nr:hypothetical protein [Amanita phalloides]
MVAAIVKDDKTFYIHKNIIIDENTTINIYLDKIKNSIQSLYESGYPITEFNILQIKFWEYNPKSINKGRKISSSNTIHKFTRGFHTSNINNKIKNKNLNLIKPLKEPKIVNKSLITTIDLETIEFKGNQLPISISFSYFVNSEIVTLFELIDQDLILTNADEAVKSLWLNFMNKLIDLNLNNCVIYSHNLGSFDGYFIFKGLLELPDIDIDNVNSIIDDLHRFISIGITWKGNKFIFKDSLRLFPISLKELTKIFEVEGKLHPYNPLFNKLSLFNNKLLLDQFIQYSKQDSISLLNALNKAQDIYLEEHKVDFASIKFKTRKTLNNNRYLPIKINHKFLNKIRLLHKFNKK